MDCQPPSAQVGGDQGGIQLFVQCTAVSCTEEVNQELGQICQRASTQHVPAFLPSHISFDMLRIEYFCLKAVYKRFEAV